jgi:hypothetical protein
MKKIFSFLLLILMIGCSGGTDGEDVDRNSNDESLPIMSALSATTLAASSVNSLDATVNGRVIPSGSLTTAWFEWGTDQTFGTFSTTPAQRVNSGITTQLVSDHLTGLSNGTTYYFRIAASDGTGTFRGTVSSFTPSSELSVTTLAANSINSLDTTVSGMITPKGTATTAWFEFGTDQGFGTYSATTAQPIPAGTSSQIVTDHLTNLSNETTYYFRIAASDGSDTYRGTVSSFTPGSELSVRTLAVTSFYGSSTTVNGNVTPNGSAMTAWFEWGTDPSFATYNATTAQGVDSGTATQLVSQSLTGLSFGTTYYFRIAASDDTGTYRGTAASFTPGSSPRAEAYFASPISTSGATLQGILMIDQSQAPELPTTYWFEWGTDPLLSAPNLTQPQSIPPGNGNMGVIKGQRIGGLTGNTTYYYRFVAQNNLGTAMGSITTVTTLSPGWPKTIGGPGSDMAGSVQQTSDGGYVMVGKTMSDITNSYDIYLIKTDADGTVLWTKTYGGQGHENGSSVRQTSDGGYIISGSTTPYSASDDCTADAYLVKTDAAGTVLWTKTFGMPGKEDSATSVQQTSDGGYILVGETMSFGAGSYDFYIIKTDASGNAVWTRTFGKNSCDYATSVQQTPDGGYIIAGTTMAYEATNPYGAYNILLLKMDANGNASWWKLFGGDKDDFSGTVRRTSDGGYILAGTTYSFGAGYCDLYLIKTDSSGNALWTKTLGGTDADGGGSVVQASDGGYIVAGSSQSFGAGAADVYLLKTDSSGNVVWTRTFGGPDSEGGASVQQTSDGGYVVSAYTNSFGEGDWDVYLIKTDSNGLIEQ